MLVCRSISAYFLSGKKGGKTIDYKDFLDPSTSEGRTVQQFTSRAYHGAKKRAMNAALPPQQAAKIAQQAYAEARDAYNNYWGI